MESTGGYVARKRSRVESCLHRLLYAGFFVLGLLALGAPSGAVDEYDSTSAVASGAADESDATVAAPSGAVEGYERTPQERCRFLGGYGRAPEKPCIWDDYDSKDAGHPLRIAAYVLHPVGVIIDRLIFRPAYWIGSHEPFYTLFGRTD
jgi:hypothetical protein